jgi:hypothetical protein
MNGIVVCLLILIICLLCYLIYLFDNKVVPVQQAGQARVIEPPAPSEAGQQPRPQQFYQQQQQQPQSYEQYQNSIHPVPTHPQPAHPQPIQDYEILERQSDGSWGHHSWRHSNHSDLIIYSSHTRFNVRRPDGSLVRGEYNSE